MQCHMAVPGKHLPFKYGGPDLAYAAGCILYKRFFLAGGNVAVFLS